MQYSPRYRLFPDAKQREALDWTRDTVRQVYNHALHEFDQMPEDAGTLRQRVWSIRDNINSLGELKAKGYDVGSLNWKKPREYRSFTYRQSGFELDKKSGPNGRGFLVLKKVRGDTLEIPVRHHRNLPNHEAIKEVTLKKEPTGAWYVSFCIETDAPEKPAATDIDPEDTVGLDLGVLNFVHDSDGRSIGRLDLTDDRERLEREQRALSRKQYESNNWEKQRRRVAEVHARMSNKKRDYKHKLAHYYTTAYDAVFVEDPTSKGCSNPQRTLATRPRSGGATSSPFSHTTVRRTRVTSWKLNPRGRRGHVLRVVWRRGNRCGCASTRARRAGSNSTGTGTRR